MSQSAPSTEAQGLSLSSLIALVTLAALPVTFTTAFSSYEYMRKDVLLALAGLALASWCIETIRAKKITLLDTRAPALIGALGTWALISSAWSPSWLAGLADSGVWFALAATALALTAPTGRALQPATLIAAGSVGTAAAGLAGLLDLAGIGLFTVTFDAPGATGAFDAAEFGFAYYAVSLPLSAALLGHKETPYKAAGVAAIITGCAHLSMLGTSWLHFGLLAAGLIIATAFAMTLGGKRGKPNMIALAASALILIAGALGPATLGPQDEPYNPATSLPIMSYEQVAINPDSLREKRARDARFDIFRPESVTDPQARDYVRQLSRAHAAERPLLGLGAAGFWLSQSRIVLGDHPFLDDQFDTYPVFRSPHNGFLKILIEYGVLGLVLFALLVCGVLARLKPNSDTKEDELDATLIWGASASALAGLAVMADTALLTAPEALLAWTLALSVIGMITSKPKTIETNPLALSGPLFLAATAVIALGAFSLTSSFYRGKGDQLMLYGKHEAARTAFMSAHHIFPAHGEALYNWALTLENSKERDKLDTKEELSIALTLRPDDARILHQVGKYYLTTQRISQMIDSETKAINRNPNLVEAYEYIAVGHDMNHDFLEATEILERALAQNPPTKARHELHTTAGRYFSGPANKPAKALDHYKKALALTEDSVLQTRLTGRITELEKRVERERLIREGKPVPLDLMPADQHNAAGEILGAPGHGHGHGHGQQGGMPPMIKPPPGLPPMPKHLQQKTQQPHGHGAHEGHDH